MGIFCRFLPFFSIFHQKPLKKVYHTVWYKNGYFLCVLSHFSLTNSSIWDVLVRSFSSQRSFNFCINLSDTLIVNHLFFFIFILPCPNRHSNATHISYFFHIPMRSNPELPPFLSFQLSCRSQPISETRSPKLE